MKKARVEASLTITREEVLEFLDIEDEDYMPTDDEWRQCAQEKLENDEFEYGTLYLD